MDAETGKLLNYWHLRQNLKYKEGWNLSSANEFGRLANGVGGRVKGTNTIIIFHRHEAPKKCMKDITYMGSLCAWCDLKKPRRIAHDSLCVVIKSTIQAK